MVSTEADALAWARTGAPGGAVVAAGHQLAPRGRDGRLWNPGEGDVCFSMVLRPDPGGRIYVAAGCGLADALGAGSEPAWPDEVWRGDARAGAVSAGAGGEWAVLSVLVARPRQPAPQTIAAVVSAIEARLGADFAAVLDDYRRRCRTLGRPVRARLVPVGPAGREVTGRAVGVRSDGALVVERADGHRVAVRPDALGVLEDATETPTTPPPGMPGAS